MSERITLEKIEEHLTFFNKMYDTVRIVDPVLKRVLEHREGTVNKLNEICHSYWKSGKICDNCISVKAYQENRSFMKLEQTPDVIMMVTALPVENAGTPITLELMKNATDSMMIGSGYYNDGQFMRNVVCEINNLVVRDQLTSLYNRRFVDDRLPVDIINATLSETPLTVIFADMDSLKHINDVYGHPAGDSALKEVAGAIQNSIRAESDWAARYGGDEFLICLNNASYKEACDIARRIRDNVEKIDMEVQNISFPVSVSLGIHTMEGSSLTAKEIIKLADQKMYEAKKLRENLLSEE